MLQWHTRMQIYAVSIRYVRSPLYSVPSLHVSGPHIGHLYSALLADALQRWSRVADSSRPVIFSTGTDEHGLKVKKAAEAQGRPPQAFSDEVSDSFKVCILLDFGERVPAVRMV